MASKTQTESRFSDKLKFDIAAMRISVITTVVGVAIIGGYLAYSTISKLETRVFILQYDSLTKSLFEAAAADLQAKLGAGDATTTMVSLHCPNKTNWPYCSYPQKDFDKLLSTNLYLTEVYGVGFCPIISSSDLPAFENFAKDLYRNDPAFPAFAGYSTFGFGVYAINYTSKALDPRYHDVTGFNPYSEYNYIAPLIQETDVVRHSFILLFNLHSGKSNGFALDQIYSCNRTINLCRTAITDVFAVPAGFSGNQPNLGLDTAATIVNGVYADDTDDLVGFTSVLFDWRTVLTSPLSFSGSLDCVLFGPNTVFTYEVSQSGSSNRCLGDCHDNEYDDMARHVRLLPIATVGLLTAKTLDVDMETDYKMTCYPQSSYENSFRLQSAKIAVIVIVATMLFVSIVFALYDIMVGRQSLAKEQLLESKRAYVRFISHEIRTPINTFSVGMKVLINDLASVYKGLDGIQGCEGHAAALKEIIELSREIDESSVAATVVLNDLLEYDKIENKTLQIEKKIVPILPLVFKIVRPLLVEVKFAGVVLEFTVMGEPVDIRQTEDLINSALVVVGDNLKIGQVIRNITSNAVKFTPKDVNAKISISGISFYYYRMYICASLFIAVDIDEKKPEICKVQCPKDCEPVGILVLSVCDEGPGMSEDEIYKLFSEGVQFNPNQLQAGQGSGLGLWISKGIIEAHGGSIRAVSDGHKKGSKFIVTLPLFRVLENHLIDVNFSAGMRTSYVEEVSSTSGMSRQKSDLDSVTEPSARSLRPGVSMLSSFKSASSAVYVADAAVDNLHLSSLSSVSTINREAIVLPAIKKILIVDDAPSNRKFVRRLLQTKGFVIEEANDGFECLEKVATGSYDLILLDYEMPHMNGPQVVKELRGKGIATKVFGLTGNCLPEDVKLFLEHGADEVLPKPLNWERLAKLLQTYFNSSAP
jgi:signal transduction histidine kinase/CheY-like chemotaxis protein